MTKKIRPFERTDISDILNKEIKFISLEFRHSKISSCNLFLGNSKDENLKTWIPFTGDVFESQLVLYPEQSNYEDLSKYDFCYLSLDIDPEATIGNGLSNDETYTLLTYAYK